MLRARHPPTVLHATVEDHSVGYAIELDTDTHVCALQAQAQVCSKVVSGVSSTGDV